MKLLKFVIPLCLFAALAVTAEAEAAAVSVSSLELSDGGAGGALLDDDRTTKVTASDALTIKIALSSPARQMYAVWDGPVSPWELETGGKAAKQNEHGFLHEYVEFSEPLSTVSMSLPAGAKLCDLYFFGEGETPAWVERWEVPHEDADMLLLPTHADDEHLWFGGSLPYYAGELGYKVQVAYMTNHWGEPYRPHEILNGLWRVGVRAYPIMGPFSDMYSETAEDAAAQYGRDETTAWQVELLRRFKPEVVLAHDIGGEYGHGAHMLNAETLLRALELSADDGNYPDSAGKYGVWQVKKAYLHLWRENEIIMDWDAPLASFGGKTAFEMAREGYGEHVSQHIWDFSVDKSGPFDCRRFGLAWSTVGPDENKNDFFENIVYEPEPLPEPEPEPEPMPEPDTEAESEPELDSQPEQNPPPEEKTGDDRYDWLIRGAGIAGAVVCIICGIIFGKRVKRNDGGHHTGI